MIGFKEVVTNCFGPLSLEISAGSLCAVVTESGREKKAFLNTLLGVKQPAGGQVLLFGKDIHRISLKEMLTLFQKVGMAWKDGGLISNLKIWENLLLPVRYHTNRKAEEVEEKILKIFEAFGLEASSGYMSQLPGRLPIAEKSLIGVARAMLMEPDVIIYDALFDGLSPEREETVRQFTAAFHKEKPKRISLYISSNEHSLRSLEADVIFRQQGQGFSS